MTIKKIILFVIGILLGVWISNWSFNHIDAYVGMIMFCVTGFSAGYLIYKIVKTYTEN